MATLREHRLALGLLFALCMLAALGKLALIGTTPSSDYAEYLATAERLAGIEAPAYPERLLKPLAPLGVALVALLTGFPTAFLLEVLTGYFAFALALYALGYSFFGDKRSAVFVALLGTLSYPVLRYGIDLYTETGALAFYCLSLWLTLRYLKGPSRTLIVWNALTIGLGFLWKEYSIVAGVIFGLALLAERLSWSARVKNLAFLGALALIPTALIQAWVYTSYHYTYLDWYLRSGANGFATEFTLRNIVKSTFALLGLAWLWVPVGLMRFRELGVAQKRFLALALLPPFIVLVWGHVSSRLFFPIAPACILLAVWGLAALPRRWQWATVAAVIAADIAWLFAVA